MEIEHARTIARETVAETFLALGVDMVSPHEVKNVQEDFAFLRIARYSVRKAWFAVMTAVIGSAAVGAAGLIWKAIVAANAGVQ